MSWEYCAVAIGPDGSTYSYDLGTQNSYIAEKEFEKIQQKHSELIGFKWILEQQPLIIEV